METKYKIIQEIHRDARIRADALASIPEILESWGIGLRTDDGMLYQINISHPDPNIFIVGLRYKKRDESFTEDLFEFSSMTPNEVTKHYRGSYERKRPEYIGTHKKQDVNLSNFTSVNSCSLLLSDSSDS